MLKERWWTCWRVKYENPSSSSLSSSSSSSSSLSLSTFGRFVGRRFGTGGGLDTDLGMRPLVAGAVDLTAELVEVDVELWVELCLEKLTEFFGGGSNERRLLFLAAPVNGMYRVFAGLSDSSSESSWLRIGAIILIGPFRFFFTVNFCGSDSYVFAAGIVDKSSFSST